MERRIKSYLKKNIYNIIKSYLINIIINKIINKLKKNYY